RHNRITQIISARHTKYAEIMLTLPIEASPANGSQPSYHNWQPLSRKKFEWNLRFRRWSVGGNTVSSIRPRPASGRSAAFSSQDDSAGRMDCPHSPRPRYEPGVYWPAV